MRYQWETVHLCIIPPLCYAFPWEIPQIMHIPMVKFHPPDLASLFERKICTSIVWLPWIVNSQLNQSFPKTQIISISLQAVYLLLLNDCAAGQVTVCPSYGLALWSRLPQPLLSVENKAIHLAASSASYGCWALLSILRAVNYSTLFWRSCEAWLGCFIYSSNPPLSKGMRNAWVWCHFEVTRVHAHTHAL